MDSGRRWRNVTISRPALGTGRPCLEPEDDKGAWSPWSQWAGCSSSSQVERRYRRHVNSTSGSEPSDPCPSVDQEQRACNFGEQLCYSACKTDSDPSSRAVAASVRPISQWTAGHGKLKLCAATPASLLPTSCSGKSGAEIFFNQGHSFSQLNLSSKALIYFIVMENGNAALAFHTGGAGLTRRYIVDFELLLSDDATLPQEGFRMLFAGETGGREMLPQPVPKKIQMESANSGELKCLQSARDIAPPFLASCQWKIFVSE